MKHFIHLNDFSKQEIFQIFELADKLKADNGECDWLKGKAFACASILLASSVFVTASLKVF